MSCLRLTLAALAVGVSACGTQKASDAGAIDAAPEDFVPPGATVLASGQSPCALALDTNNVYWVNCSCGPKDCSQPTGSVMRCAIGGCNDAPTAIATAQVYPTAVAVDSTNVYWMGITDGANSVLSCPISGCSGSPSVIASHQGGWWGIAGLAVDDTNVYWVSNADINSGAIMTCPKTGCGTAPTRLAPLSLQVYGFAIDATGVYWTMGVGKPGVVMRCAKTGCNETPTQLATGSYWPGGIVVDSTTAYWSAGSQVVSCATTGCGGQPTVVVPCTAPLDGDGTCPSGLSAQASGLAIDPTTLYWANAMGGFAPIQGFIASCDVTACDGGNVRPAGFAASSVLVDSTSLYWLALGQPAYSAAAPGSGMILKAPK